MGKRILLVALVILFSVIFVGCGDLPTPKPGEYYDISVTKTQEIMEEDPTAVILDVRTPQEYQSGHIPGSMLIPVDDLEGRMSELENNKDKIIVVVCLSGERSGFAARILAKNGFTKVYNMNGGMNLWKGPVQ